MTVIWNNSHLRDKRPSFAHLLTLLFVWAAFCNPGLNLRLIILLLVTLRVASWWTLFQVFLFFCCDAISAVLVLCLCFASCGCGCVVVFLQNTISSILLWCWVAVHLGEPGVQLQFEIESARYLIGILTCHSESSYCHSYCHHQSSQRHRRCIASCPPPPAPAQPLKGSRPGQLIDPNLDRFHPRTQTLLCNIWLQMHWRQKPFVQLMLLPKKSGHNMR